MRALYPCVSLSLLIASTTVSPPLAVGRVCFCAWGRARQCGACNLHTQGRAASILVLALSSPSCMRPALSAFAAGLSLSAHWRWLVRLKSIICRAYHIHAQCTAIVCHIANDMITVAAIRFLIVRRFRLGWRRSARTLRARAHKQRRKPEHAAWCVAAHERTPSQNHTQRPCCSP